MPSSKRLGAPGNELCSREADAGAGRQRISRGSGHDVAGRGERRAGVGAAAGASIGRGEVAVGARQAVALVVFVRSEEAAALPREAEVLAEDLLIRSVGGAVSQQGLGAAPVLARDDIHHAGDRI